MGLIGLSGEQNQVERYQLHKCLHGHQVHCFVPSNIVSDLHALCSWEPSRAKYRLCDVGKAGLCIRPDHLLKRGYTIVADGDDVFCKLYAALTEACGLSDADVEGIEGMLKVARQLLRQWQRELQAVLLTLFAGAWQLSEGDALQRVNQLQRWRTPLRKMALKGEGAAALCGRVQLNLQQGCMCERPWEEEPGVGHLCRCFGTFFCSTCSHRWHSGYAYKGFTQDCAWCDQKCKPQRLAPRTDSYLQYINE